MTGTEGIDLTGYAFYSMRNEEIRAMGADPLPMPVRKELEQEVFGGEEVRLDLLLDELYLFLGEYPDLTRLYAPTMETMSLLAAMEREREGDGEAAARYLETGLGAVPESLLLRSSYAVVLHVHGRGEEAREQYEIALADPEGRENPMVCLLAARLYAERGEYLEAYRLLEGQAAKLPPEDAFWDFLAEMRELAGVEDGEEGWLAGPGEEDTPPPACSGCGSPMLEEERFCSACGSPAGGREPGGATCPGCGLQLKAGSRFCRICGRPQ